ncbi:hypothetical protein OIU77_029995 [Salix suchowensis]|uniref:Transmembrane protein n=1 Tax=Salix suchowensis TaxID=1278906 RepID=A0ABQ9BAF8_9ROSI|nr:hypothetical protein OIU77_029995 [Salix suchowensis]
MVKRTFRQVVLGSTLLFVFSCKPLRSQMRADGSQSPELGSWNCAFHLLEEELDFDQEDFWTSDDSISNISPDYHQVERERCSNAAERLETENRELARAHATMESACFVVTALLPLAAFCMMKLYSDQLSPAQQKDRQS